MNLKPSSKFYDHEWSWATKQRGITARAQVSYSWMPTTTRLVTDIHDDKTKIYTCTSSIFHIDTKNRKLSFPIFYKFWLSCEPWLTCVYSSEVDWKCTVQKVPSSNRVNGGWIFSTGYFFLIEEKGPFETQDWNEMEIFKDSCLFHTRTLAEILNVGMDGGFQDWKPLIMHKVIEKIKPPTEIAHLRLVYTLEMKQNNISQ